MFLLVFYKRYKFSFFKFIFILINRRLLLLYILCLCRIQMEIRLTYCLINLLLVIFFQILIVTFKSCLVKHLGVFFRRISAS